MSRYRIKFVYPADRGIRTACVEARSLVEAVDAVAHAGAEVVRVDHLPLRSEPSWWRKIGLPWVATGALGAYWLLIMVAAPWPNGSGLFAVIVAGVIVAAIASVSVFHWRRQGEAPSMTSTSELRLHGRTALDSVAIGLRKVPTAFVGVLVLGAIAAMIRSGFDLFESPESAKNLPRYLMPFLVMLFVINPEFADTEPSQDGAGHEGEPAAKGG
jgi:hypothetical protein